jgi:hypothetical protein
MPQSSGPPQPSPAGPQEIPTSAQVFGVHCGPPQTLGTPPPPQVWLAGQSPHWMI